MDEHIRSISTDLPFSLADLCMKAQLGLEQEHQFQVTSDQLLRISMPYWAPSQTQTCCCPLVWTLAFWMGCE